MFDLAWGFHQIGLSEATSRVFTIITSLGSWSFNRLLMGYINATAIFQRVVNRTFGTCRLLVVFMGFWF